MSAPTPAGRTHFFSCDWGTTSFRLRRVDAVTGEVLEQRQDATGVRTLTARCVGGDTAENVFADFLREQLRLPTAGKTVLLDGASVIISGMASSSVGWRELPYAKAPLSLDAAGLVRAAFEFAVDAGARVRIQLISGLRTETDIMRGEETEILGIFAEGRHADIAEAGVVVLPGTHSKHVRLGGGRITDFRTYMTGELFDILSTHSLLRASVQSDDSNLSSDFSTTACRDAFAAGVCEAADRGLAGSLFQTRVRTVLHSVPPPVNRWFLSGLLIGSEVADLAAREPDARLLLAAAEPLHAAYRLTFKILGLDTELSVVPPEEMATASVRGHRVLLAAGAGPDLRPVK